MEHLFLMFLDHTKRRTTVGRTPLDEWSARRRNLYLTTHDTHNRHISMPPVGFEPKISAGERPAAAHLLRSWVHKVQYYIKSYMVDNIQSKEITSVSQKYDSNLTWNYFPVPLNWVDVFWQPLSCWKMSDLRYSVFCETCSDFCVQGGLRCLFGEIALSKPRLLCTTFSKFSEIKRMIYTDISLIGFIHPT